MKGKEMFTLFRDLVNSYRSYILDKECYKAAKAIQKVEYKGESVDYIFSKLKSKYY